MNRRLLVYPVVAVAALVVEVVSHHAVASPAVRYGIAAAALVLGVGAMLVWSEGLLMGAGLPGSTAVPPGSRPRPRHGLFPKPTSRRRVDGARKSRDPASFESSATRSTRRTIRGALAYPTLYIASAVALLLALGLSAASTGRTLHEVGVGLAAVALLVLLWGIGSTLRWRAVEAETGHFQLQFDASGEALYARRVQMNLAKVATTDVDIGAALQDLLAEESNRIFASEDLAGGLVVWARGGDEWVLHSAAGSVSAELMPGLRRTARASDRDFLDDLAPEHSYATFSVGGATYVIAALATAPLGPDVRSEVEKTALRFNAFILAAQLRDEDTQTGLIPRRRSS